MPIDRNRAVFIAVGVPVGCAMLGTVVTGDAVRTWYPTLRTSKLVLPLWAFLPVALLYYLMCGRILYRLLTIDTPTARHTQALVLLASMMGANEGWNYVFLGRRSVRGGILGMIAYTLLTVALQRTLKQVDQPSARLLVLYVGWLGYDLLYAYELWRLNKA